MHGYQVSSALRSAGLGRIGGGTIYPLLARLQEAELLSFSWQIEETGPARKVFSLTPKGSLRFNELIADWRRLDATITSIRKVV